MPTNEIGAPSGAGVLLQLKMTQVLSPAVIKPRLHPTNLILSNVIFDWSPNPIMADERKSTIQQIEMTAMFLQFSSNH